MAYTRSWSNSTPAGTRPAKQIDDAIREFKTDFYERFVTLLNVAGDIDTDPLVLADKYLGKLTERVISISPHGLIGSLDDDDISRGDGYVQSDNDDAHGIMYMQVMLPSGIEIVKFEAGINIGGFTSVTAYLYASAIDGSTAAIAAGTRSTAGDGIIDSGVFSFVPVDGQMLNIKLVGTGGNGSTSRYKSYGFKITYNRSSNLLGI